MSSPTRNARLSLHLVMLALVAAVMAMMASLASAAPATQQWTGQASGATPDIQRTGVSLLRPDGSPVTISSGEVGTLNFTIDGVAHIGLCVDTSRPFAGVPVAVDVSPVTAPNQTDRAVAWILANRLPSGASTPAAQTQAAAAQIAVWLLRGQVNEANPSNVAALNTAAKALRSEALAVAATPASLGMSVSAPVAGATTATITVSGRPGAVVALSVTSGAGTLSASSVTIGASGTGSAVLTAAGPGNVAVSATTAGDATLYVVDPAGETQNTSYAVPTVMNAATNVAFTAAPTVPSTSGTSGTVTTPGTVETPRPATTPAPTATARNARLTIVKAGPARALAGAVVRYTVKVTNTGTAPARNEDVIDRLPGGLTLTSRAGTRTGSSVRFAVGTLAPGASKVIVVSVRARSGLTGRRVNVATATATGVARVAARAVTRFVAPTSTAKPAVVAPAVTG